jgi:hypothetical protein
MRLEWQREQNMWTKLLMLTACLALFCGHICLASDNGVILQTGGTKIMLDEHWERLEQPENFYIQKRALNADRKLALSAGAFITELTLEEYFSLGIYGLEQGPEKGMEQGIKLTANRAHVSVKEVKKAVESRLGQQTLDELKKTSASCRYDFLSATNIEISGTPAFEVHSKVIMVKSGQTVFTRLFIFHGSEPQQIVQITCSGLDDDVFRDKSLIDAIKPKP